MKKKIQLEDRVKMKTAEQIEKEFGRPAPHQSLILPDGEKFNIGLCHWMCGKEHRVTGICENGSVMVMDDEYRLFYSPLLFDLEEAELKIVTAHADFYDFIDDVVNAVGLQCIIDVYEKETGHRVETVEGEPGVFTRVFEEA
jgi:hypothetical protein